MSLLEHLIKNAYSKHQHRHNNHDYGFRTGSMGTSPILHNFLRKGKKLIYALIAVIGLVLLLLIVLLVVMSPMIFSGIDWVYHNGINGVIKLLQTILDKLWKGAGV